MQQQSIRWHSCSLLALVCRPSCHPGHGCCCCQQAPPGVPAAVPEPTCSACNCSAAGLQAVQGATVCGRAVPEDRAWRATGVTPTCCGSAAAYPCSIRVWQCLGLGSCYTGLQATWLPQSVHACLAIDHWLKALPSLPVQPTAGWSRHTQCSSLFPLLQSPFFKGRERLAESSVEEHITAVLLPAFRAEAHKFITAGGDPGLHSVQAAVAPALKG